MEVTNPPVEKIALFDMDSTLCDYEGQMLKDLQTIASPSEQHLLSIHDVRAKWMENRMDVIKRQPGWWRSLPVLQDGFKVFAECRRLGFEMHILTKGPFRTTAAWSEKVEWVRAYLPHDVKVTITEDKGHTYGTILCEDWPPYIERWLTWRKRGLVVLLDRRYNREKFINHPQVVRYDGTPNSWLDVQARLQQAYARQPGSDFMALERQLAISLACKERVPAGNTSSLL